MTPIENDEEVKSMFQCHITFSQLSAIEIYVRLLEHLETYLAQSIQLHQYGMSQTTDDEPTQTNKPFIPNEERCDGNENLIDTPTVAVRAQPISLYNPPGHMQNISLDDAEPIFAFGSFTPIHNADDIDEGMKFENKEACDAALQHWHIKRSLDYSMTKSDNVDGTWLYGKYRGTLLMDVAHHRNRNIFPIVFPLVEDIHESINSAYKNPENGWHDPPSSHIYCIRHIAQNFTREIKDKELHKKLVNMGYTLTEAAFNYYHGEIRRTNNDALSWIDNIPREKWAKAYDGGKRWGHITTNLAEAMNSVLKETRNLPITASVQSTYYRLGSLFGKRGHQWTKMLASGQVFTDNCNKGMAEEVSKANTHNVMQFDRERFYFMVHEKINQNDGRLTVTFSVDLRKQHCDCGKFQAFHLPCSYVIATCSSMRQDYSIHIPYVLKFLNVFKVYKESFL
ncbi:uncharacterized protein LOC127104729 [Lathyrus oleraceus]|uniref:uncharacterized protein LOC127104729 n=1 Tax=Pisum sativum TaxID=3888 RepID=UPI0021D05966|nr:uncharacterized protein LOC127104729 [Pisum sativum]